MFKTTDLVHYKILDKYDVYLKPLNVNEKSELTLLMLKATKGDYESALKATNLGICLSLKRIDGLKDQNEFGEEVDFKLEFDKDGKVSMDSLSDLMNNDVANHINQICSMFINCPPTEFKNDNGEPLETIKYVGRNTHLGKK